MDVRTLGRWVKGCLIGAVFVWAATLAGLVAFAGPQTWAPGARAAQDLPARADAIVCLGAGMSRSLGWQEPDNASRRRALTCAALFQAGVAPLIVFTGYGHEISSVAAAMGRVAAQAGVPAQAIVLEEAAQSTIQNAVYATALLPDDVARLVVVTDPVHVPRSRVIFRRVTPAEIHMVAADTRLAPPVDRGDRSELRWFAREATAIWSNLARATAYRLGGWAGIDAATRVGWFN